MNFKRKKKYLYLFVFSIILWISSSAIGGNPEGVYYSDDNTNIFWFALISDTHIGNPFTIEDRKHVDQFLSEVHIINPKIIVATGDLTDHSRCNPITGGKPCNHIREWNEYRLLFVNKGGMTIDIYSDAPGNHDQYWDGKPLMLYLFKSVQGRATNQTQRSWTYRPDFGKYHFINTATPHPDYTIPFFDWLAGNPSELSEDEIDFIEEELNSHNDANLTFVFGHHYIDSLIVGKDDFVSLLQNYKVSLYGYGHTHNYAENIRNNVLHLNVASLWDSNHYALIAVDSDGISVTPAVMDQWPVVLITAPIDKNLGGTNPYTYKIPSSTSNPIRAIVFDDSAVTQVQYRIDGKDEWYSMSKVRLIGGSNSYLWETKEWDTTSLGQENHTLEVRATGSTTRSDIITFEIEKK
jgi:predicted phosphodiesterase